MSSRLIAANHRLRKAEDAFETALRRDYPAGAAVRWDRNGVHSGHVVQHGYGHRLQVTNARTGRTLWIHADDVVRALHARPLVDA